MAEPTVFTASVEGFLTMRYNLLVLELVTFVSLPLVHSENNTMPRPLCFNAMRCQNAMLHALPNPANTKDATSMIVITSQITIARADTSR